MIKRVQLRGISRTPSDRTNSDGGCSESFNVHLDMDEIAPTMPPDDITDDIYRTATVKYPIIFIHKMLGYTNYIGYSLSARTLRAYGANLAATGISMGGAVISSGEGIAHITSVGNTLIAFTKVQTTGAPGKPYYFLFKDGAYNYLGSEIPRPLIEVVSRPSDNDVRTWTIPFAPTQDSYDIDTSTDPADWRNAKAEGNRNHARLLEVMNYFWGRVSATVNERRQDGIFAAPFFVRYALKLYDGNYIHVSTPILCGAGKSADWLTARVEPSLIVESAAYNEFEATLNNLFKVRVRGSYAVGNWGDIVKSIDFFASTPIYAPAMEAEFGDLLANGDVVFAHMDSSARAETIKEEVLSKSQFYKIKSISLDNSGDMAKLGDGTMRIESSDDVSGERLALHEDLEEGYRSSIQYVPFQGASGFNNRVMLVGASERLSRGDAFLNGQMSEKTGTSTASVLRYGLRYKIVNPISGDSCYVNAHYRDDGTVLYPGVMNENNGDSDNTIQQYGNSVGSSTLHYLATPYSWLCYPDSRCIQVEIFYYSSTGTYQSAKIIPMEPHPNLECSYAFLGLGVSLQDVKNGSGSFAPGSSSDRTAAEQLYISSSNKLFLSEVDNPFLFPASGIITFPDELIGAATTSVPLSEGQFGDFPLYVFTEGGIRVLALNSQGTFTSNYAHPNLSRHVAKKGTILPIEQAVVFVTDKGVMLLSGSTVTELSRTMNGMPYALDEEIKLSLASTAWSDMARVSGEDVSAFMSSLADVRPAYDSKGGRIILFDAGHGWEWVYMLETQSWHKEYSGVYAHAILNSYPDCLVSDVTYTTPMVMSFSTALDKTSEVVDTVNDPIYGLIATRPLDFGEPDVRKTIKSLRIRGFFEREDVQYILLGSFDCIHWKRLYSLRGGSYKFFRIVLLTKMRPSERIAWIDIDYEPRYNNKLR